MAVSIGDEAPNFELNNTELERVELDSFKGEKQVVLLFFPLAFTGVCTDELCQMRDNLKDYEQLDAQVLAVSVDSPFALKEFKQQQNYNFPLLSDFNKEVAETYGSLYQDFKGMEGVAKRSAFVIGKNGRVKHAEVLENAGDIPDFNAVKDALKN